MQASRQPFQSTQDLQDPIGSLHVTNSSCAGRLREGDVGAWLAGEGWVWLSDEAGRSGWALGLRLLRLRRDSVGCRGADGSLGSFWRFA